MHFGKKLVLFSLVAVCVLTGLLYYASVEEERSASGTELMFYCAAGIKPPVEAVVWEYEQAYGVRIQLQYGGSGTLLSNLRVAGSGDLYLAGDDSYIALGRTHGLVAESVPLATLRPVIAVQKGNPRGIVSLSDLMREDVAVAVGNPDAAAVGKVTRRVLTGMGMWESFEKHVKVFKPTVMDVANDIRLGAVDAGIIWDATANQHPEVDMVVVPELARAAKTIAIGVLTTSQQPTAALRFIRYLGARDRGLRAFARFGYQPVDGDVWAEAPELVFYSGGVNRLAVEKTVAAFEAREGVRVTSVYNGCGILVSQMKAGASPDAYFACDRSFMVQVNDLFVDPMDVSETDMVFLVPKGNPRGIHALADLGRAGLKVGLANAEQSALGALTKRLLERTDVYAAVMGNVKTQSPTADLLVNQMRTGSLDAVIVYEANTAYVREHLDILPIPHPDAKAVQPIAVNKGSKHTYLGRRLVEAILSSRSRETFESLGFRWKAEGE